MNIDYHFIDFTYIQVKTLIETAKYTILLLLIINGAFF